MKQSRGFTLIELMIVVTIIAILTAIAMPAYNDYATKAKLTEAFTALSSLQARMEQYYQDNREYSCAAVTTPDTANFSFAIATNCFTTAENSRADQHFTYKATGIAAMSGFVLSITDDGTKRTLGVGQGWTAPTTNCWVRTRGGAC